MRARLALATHRTPFLFRVPPDITALVSLRHPTESSTTQVATLDFQPHRPSSIPALEEHTQGPPTCTMRLSAHRAQLDSTALVAAQLPLALVLPVVSAHRRAGSCSSTLAHQARTSLILVAAASRTVCHAQWGIIAPRVPLQS